jgi:hypothetical protein
MSPEGRLLSGDCGDLGYIRRLNGVADLRQTEGSVVSLVIVFAVVGALWLLGARYAVANRRWFFKVLDRLARKRGTSWEESSWFDRTRLFVGAAGRLDSDSQREARLFTPSAHPEVESARLEAAKRFRTYAKAMSIFAGVVLAMCILILVVLGVHALVS